MKTIAVIGAGTMGNGIAHTFAQSGFVVKLIDVSEKALDKGMATIASNLDRMIAKGTITEEEKFTNNWQYHRLYRYKRRCCRCRFSC
jgi:3-hydroxybutyryl-CoA dehydrogenase